MPFAARIMAEGTRRRTTVRLAALVLILGACAAPTPTGPAEGVFLPVGSTLASITDSLTAHGLIGSPRWFALLARVGHYDRKLKAGYYEFQHGERALDILRALAAGSEKTTRITIPEGYTILDIAAVAQERLGVPADSFVSAARDSSLVREFGAEGESLEGFLLPETYFVSRLTTARGLVREMAGLFRRQWRPDWDARARAAGLSRRELVTLASIVEGEAKVDSDRPLIAAVYMNRVRLRMPLQADPTVQFAIQMQTGSRKPRLFERDYHFPSPYNTYLHPGLPPSPVGAPSVKSIEAVLAPAAVPYLYFVAGQDGKHVFSKTYGEHLRTVARIQAAARAARRKEHAQ